MYNCFEVLFFRTQYFWNNLSTSLVSLVIHGFNLKVFSSNFIWHNIDRLVIRVLILVNGIVFKRIDGLMIYFTVCLLIKRLTNSGLQNRLQMAIIDYVHK